MPGGDAREAARTVTGSFEDFPLPAGAARPRPRRRHDRPHRRDARRAVRARGAQRLADRRPAGPGHPAGPVLAGRGPGRAGGVHPGLRGPAEGAGRRALDARRRAGAEERRGRRSPTPAPAATWPARSPRGCARTSPRCAGACPAPSVVLQLDEPSLIAVLRGQVKTASGYRTHRAVDRQRRRGHAAGRRRRCTRGRPGRGALLRAGRAVRAAAQGRARPAISFDFSLLTERDDDAIGEAVEGGHRALRRCRAGHGRPIVRPCR